MKKDPEAIKIMQMRRLVLSNLNRLYPTPLQIRTLYRVLCAFDENYSLSLLKKDITYLDQKNYLEYIDEQIGGSGPFEKKFVGLTAEGKEIADNIQSDSALEL